MYRRNLDIALTAVIAILGGLAAAGYLPRVVAVPLGVGLFLAPGYLWSSVILSQRMSGTERVMTSVGMTLLLPIIGGFLLYALRIPLHKADWIGTLVVLTLAGVVAVAVQRLRRRSVTPEEPQEQEQQEEQEEPQQGSPRSRRGGASSAVNIALFGVAALVGVGAVVFSVKNAEAQKFPGYSALSMTQIVPGAQSFVGTQDTSPGNPQAGATKATKARLRVDNREGVTEQYQVRLYQNTVLIKTWTFILGNGETWQQTIPFTLLYPMAADLYILPNSAQAVESVNNGS